MLVKFTKCFIYLFYLLCWNKLAGLSTGLWYRPLKFSWSVNVWSCVFRRPLN